MTVTIFWTYIGGIVTFAVQLIVFIRWIYARKRDQDVQRTFVRDMAVNHLPHIYVALRKIAQANDVYLEDPPRVQFIEFNGKR